MNTPIFNFLVHDRSTQCRKSINALQSEITFLRYEILSKNAAIKILINDTNHNTHNAMKPNINVNSRTIKVKQTMWLRG